MKQSNTSEVFCYERTLGLLKQQETLEIQNNGQTKNNQTNVQCDEMC